MGIFESIVSVWTSMMEWISGAITSAQGIFWVSETGLTFVGTLTVMGLSIAVVFLIIGVIQNFLRLRS